MKLLLVCQDIFGSSMAGPAIRYYEFAKELSKKHEVILSIPNKTDIVESAFKIHSREEKQIYDDIKSVDCMIIQRIKLKEAIVAKRYGVKIIFDAYDPEPLEHLEVFKNSAMKYRDHRHLQTLESLLFSFQMADAVICANIPQRDLWTGVLLAQNKLQPAIYDQDPTLRSFIDVVPFGHPSTPPKKNGMGIKEKFKLKESDKVMLWGGGIWNWFDPLTLIQAIEKLSKTENPIHLIFMGVKHPNEKIPEMKMVQFAINLAKNLNLIDRYVFFNYGWTPYQERQAFLLDADIGVSTHSEHIETRYAFRTRILDYIWAKLPILATEGDSFAELIKQKEIGEVVPYQDPEAIVRATVKILQTPDHYKKNFEKIQSDFTWEKVVEPIHKMLEGFSKHKKKKLSYNDVKNIFYTFYKIRGPEALIKKFKSQLR